MPEDIGRVEMTRGEAAEQRYAGQNYDHALPQGWVDACCEKGMDPRGHFVWLFDQSIELSGVILL